MASCKYCGKEITWLKDGRKFTPVESDGGVHECDQYKNMRKSYREIDPKTLDPAIIKEYQDKLRREKEKSKK